MWISPPSRLSGKLLAVIIPAVVLGVSGIVWFQYRLARREILSAIDRDMRLLAQRTGGTIDELLDQRYRDLFNLSETPLIADYYRNVDFQLLDEAEVNRKELQRYFDNFAARGRVYAQIVYIDAAGREICRVGKQTAGAFLTAVLEKARNAPADEWWSTPVENVAGTGPVVFYVKQIRNEFGELKGALLLGYDLAQLRQLLAGIEVGRRGSAYVLSTDGRRVEGRLRFNDTSERLSAVSGLKHQPWSIVVEAPLDDFLAPLTRIKNTALAAFLAGLFALIGVLLALVRSITRPIAALADAARRIGEGDFSQRMTVTDEDELGKLARAFNEMAEHLEQNRRQLIQAEKLSAVGQLISAVAHELNNPLAAISGYVQIAMLDDLPPRLREDMAHVYNNVLRSRKVVDNLLFFVRQSRHERKRVDLNEAADAALELLEYRLRKTEDVNVFRARSNEPASAIGDFQQIVQVLVNLISNACDSMANVSRYPEGKRLDIRVGSGNSRASLEIQDNGAGIPLDAQEKIFQAFFTSKEPGHGTGLGLTISRQIVREHGGDLSFRSRPGEGAVFIMELPIGSEEDLDRLDARSAQAPFERVPGKRILVADDEREIADLIARLLREDGDDVDVATNGTDALKRLSAEAYDLVVTDMEMENVKGSDLYAALAAKGNPSKKILFVTGDILNPKVLEFLSRTNSEYMVKPFDIQELRQTVRRLLRGA